MSDGYLTMARLCEQEWVKWLAKHNMRNATGFDEIYARKSFQDGFFAGFEAKFFNNEEN